MDPAFSPVPTDAGASHPGQIVLVRHRGGLGQPIGYQDVELGSYEENQRREQEPFRSAAN